MYRPGNREAWNGRIDDTESYDAFRWHQWITPLDLENIRGPVLDAAKKEIGIAIVGFACDEGVKRNLGRPGAVNGPAAIRGELRNLPCSFDPAIRLFDCGDVVHESTLEESQIELGEKIENIASRGLFPVILGGGHETALGHWLGLRRSAKLLGIVNLDAHFDLRPYPQGGSSGTMFAQISDSNITERNGSGYLCLGVQKRGNTVALFKKAEALGARWMLARDISEGGAEAAYPLIDAFCERHEKIMITTCADVFSTAFAPGVSAPQPLGLDPEKVLRMIKRVMAGGKLIGFDVCEVAPRFDQDSTTASLAATLIFAVVNSIAELRGLAR